MARAKAPYRRLHELIGEWTSRSGLTQKFSQTRDLLTFLQGQLYNQFQPGTGEPPFVERLETWVQNVSDPEDQQQLFSFVPWLLFVGQEEMKCMYQAAMTGPIARWIIDHAKLSLDDPDIGDKFSQAVKRTYFGSIANMDISSFLRINSIEGQSTRVAYRDQSIVGDAMAFKQSTVEYDRFVAIEDMVGTGGQMQEAVPFLKKVHPKPVLICPLIVAQAGVKAWKLGVQHELEHATFSPLFVIPENACLPKKLPADHLGELSQMHKIAKTTWTQVKGSNPSPALFGPFGCGEFGSLVLSYFNCPDNVPPFIHHASDTWSALFPRNSREG